MLNLLITSNLIVDY